MSDLIRRTIGENIAVETVLAGGLWRVEIDAHQLESALLNLAVNARDAMPEGGKLTIETANAHLDDGYADRYPELTPGQYVVLCVTDTGTGMSADVIAHAFEPFYTTKPIGQGTGLGLSQVYGFVKQSGGHVKLYSEVGQGTTVKIYLPRMSAQADEEQEPPFSVLPTGGRHEVVLVVEDDDDVRLFTTESLRELGFTRARSARRPVGAEAARAASGSAAALHRRRPARHERRAARRRGARAAPGHQGAVHHRLRAQRHRAPGTARPRRRADHQAVHARRSSRHASAMCWTCRSAARASPWRSSSKTKRWCACSSSTSCTIWASR